MMSFFELHLYLPIASLNKQKSRSIHADEVEQPWYEKQFSKVLGTQLLAQTIFDDAFVNF